MSEKKHSSKLYYAWYLIWLALHCVVLVRGISEFFGKPSVVFAVNGKDIRRIHSNQYTIFPLQILEKHPHTKSQ